MCGVYVIGADGRNNHRLTRDSPTPTEFPTLTWAADGRSIAYETDRTGNGDIYVIGADGHNKIPTHKLSRERHRPLLATSIAGRVCRNLREVRHPSSEHGIAGGHRRPFKRHF